MSNGKNLDWGVPARVAMKMRSVGQILIAPRAVTAGERIAAQRAASPGDFSLQRVCAVRRVGRAFANVAGEQAARPAALQTPEPLNFHSRSFVVASYCALPLRRLTRVFCSNRFTANTLMSPSYWASHFFIALVVFSVFMSQRTATNPCQYETYLIIYK